VLAAFQQAREDPFPVLEPQPGRQP
jgi:hypothetical protein